MTRKINGFAVYWRLGRIMVERETELTGHELEVSDDGKHVRLCLTAGVAPEDDDENARRAAEEFLRRERSFCPRGAEALQDRAARF